MRKLLPVIAFCLLLALASPALACGDEPCGGRRTIRIQPHGSYYGLPIMLLTPATFNISVMPSSDPICDPHIFLVMTNSSFHGLTGNVTVEWTGDATPDLEITDWTAESDNSVTLPPNTVEGAWYTVSSLKSHLNTSEPIYWAFEPFLGGAQITQTPQEFTVTLPSTDPRMLVYALGKCCPLNCGSMLSSVLASCAPFTVSVPPTMPGYVTPQLSPMLLALASLGAFALYAIKKKR